MGAIETEKGLSEHAGERPAPPRRPTLRRDASIEIALGSVAVIGTTVTAVALGDVYWHQVFLLVNIYVIAAVGLNLLRGDAGQISFGQGAIFGVGAYATAMAAGLHGVPVPLAMLIGVAAALVVGLLLALPALRVQGYYLGFVTVAAAVVFPDLLRAWDEHTQAITGISVLVPGVGDEILWRLDWLTIVVLVVTVAALLMHGLIRSSRFGRKMRVAAESPEAALTLGISPALMRVSAFAIAAIVTGIAGVLYVPLFGFVSPGAFPLFLSILLYFAVVVGGHGTLIGPIAGIYLLYIVPNVLLAELAEYRLIIYGGIAFAAMLFLPDGLVGSVKEWIQRRFAPKGGRPVTLDPFADELGSVPAQPAGERPEPVLAIRRASKRFGAVRALDDASLEVLPGEIHGLVGPNGSGKTTLLNALSGLIDLDDGSVLVGGADVTGVGPRRRARLGIGRTFQTPRVLEDMSVWENVDVVDDSGIDGDSASIAAVREDWDRMLASNLPHAQRRLLEIARVLATRPRIVLLDEPAAGLSPEERDEFGRMLRSLTAAGDTAVVLVEHDLNLVWQVADPITVMDEGRVIASGTPDEVRRSEAVDALFAGGPRADR
ncbi:MAG: ABC transporter permease subunit [Gaiellaceae bacterium]